MNFTSISRLVSSVLIFLSWFCSIGQTTYTWRGPGGFGGSGDFQTPSHWNPTRNTPASDDILVLESSGFVTASNVPTQTVGKIILLSTSSSGGFEFQGQTGSTATFTVGEIVMQKEIAFRANTVPFNVVIGNLSTTGTVRLSNNSTTNITFTGNVLDNGIDFNGSWSNANRTFASTSTYVYNQASGVGATFSTWQTGSTYSVTGIVSDGFPQPYSDNGYTPFSNFVWDCPNQTADANMTTYNNGGLTVLGTFLVKNTGTARLRYNMGGNVFANDYLQTGGTNYIQNRTLTIYRNFEQLGGTLQTDGSASILMDNTTSSRLAIVNSSGASVTVNNTGSVGDNNITLTGNLNTINNIFHNSGNLYMNGYTIFARGTNVNLGRGGLVYGGSTSGFDYRQDQTQTVNTLPGFIGGLNSLVLSVSANCNNNKLTMTEDLTITGILSIVGFAGCGNNTEIDLNGRSLFISGNAHLNGTSSRINLNGGTLTFSGNSTLFYQRDGGTIPTATWQTGSTLSITGLTTGGNPTGFNQNFYNIIYDSPSWTNNNPFIFNGVTLPNLVWNNFIIKNINNRNLMFTNGSANVTVTINSMQILNGTLTGDNFNTNSPDIALNGDLVISSGSVFDFKNKIGLTLTGINNSTVSVAGAFINSSSKPLTINKLGGAMVSLLNNLALPNTLTVFHNSGNLSLNGNNLSCAFVQGRVHSGLLIDNSNSSSLNLRLSNTGSASTLITVPTITGRIGTVAGTNQFGTWNFTGNLTIGGLLSLTQAAASTFSVSGLNSITFDNIQRRSSINYSTVSFTTTSGFISPSGVYIHDVNNISLPTFTWLDGSVCSVTGVTANNIPGGIPNSNFFNFVWDCPAQSGTRHLGIASNQFLQVRNNFIVNNTNGNILRIAQNQNQTQRAILNNVSILGGTFYTLHENPVGGPNTFVTISGNLFIGANGTLQKTASTATNGFSSITFTGSSATLGILGTFSGVGFNAFDGVALAKNTIDDNLTLISNVTIPSSFTFILGKINTSNFIFFANSISGFGATTGWVNGNYARTIASAGVDIEFPVGTSNIYNRTRLRFPTITNNGDIVVGVQDGVHPNFSTSCISVSGYLNKTWVINTINGVSISPLSYRAIFTNDVADRIGGTTITTFTDFNPQIYSNNIWYAHTNIFARTFTNTTLDNVTLLGSFNLGLNKSLNVSISGVPQVCTSALTALTVGGITGGSSPSYQWRVNGLDVATATGAVFASTFNNNDVVDLIFNANNAGCSNNPTTTTGLSITGYSTGFWLGTNSSSISDAANWCGGNVPNATDATIPQVLPASGLFAPVISSDITVNNLYILSGAVLSSTGTNNTLQINGSLSNLGTLALDNNSLSFGIGSTSSIVGNGFRMVDMTLRNGSNVSNFVNLSISGTLTLGSANATLNNTSGNEIKLLSFATNPSSVVGTARIAAIPNGSTILGTVTQQRYFPGKNAYRYISSPIKDATLQTIRNNTFVFNFASNTINGFDLATNNFPTIYWYVETAPGMQDVGWRYYRSVTGILEVGRGYYSLILGDRTQESSLGSTSSRVASTPVTLEFRGQPNIGTINLPVTYTASVATADGWNLVGNPYPSQIDWNSGTGWSKNDLEPNIWIYDPETSNTNVTTGTGSFFTYNANTGISTPSRPNPNIIASTQGFFVRATAAGVSLTINENAKIADNHFGYFRNEAQADNIRIELSRATGEKDETVVAIRSNAVNEFNSFHDASKMMNASISVYSFTKDGKSVAINAINGDTSFNQIPLAFSAQPGSYKLKVSSTAANRKVSVLDKVTGNISEINGEDELSFTTATASATNRFVLLIDNKAVAVEENQNTIAGVAAVNSIVGTDIISQQERENNITSTKAKVNTSVNAYPNPTEGNDLKLQLLSAKNESIAISVFDIQGTLVKKYSFAVAEGENLFVIPSSDFGSGSYILQLSGSDWSKVVKLVKQ